MTGPGKNIRWNRFFHKQPRFAVVVPVDHGLTLGPLEGIQSSSQILTWLRHPVITGTIVHKGMLERLASRDSFPSHGVMVHLTGMSSTSRSPDQKERLTSIETALRLGADAVSLQVNFDGANDAHNLRLIGGIVDEAARYSLPVLAMVYDAASTENHRRISRLRHLMRVALELGVDALKVAPPAHLQELEAMLADFTDDVSVLIAGGSLRDEAQLLELARQSLRFGAAGLCVGRNVFQRATPLAVLDQLEQVILKPEMSDVMRSPLMSAREAAVRENTSLAGS